MRGPGTAVMAARRRSTIGAWVVLGGLVAGIAPPRSAIAQEATRSGDAFADCDLAMAEEPESFASAKCFHQVARSANLWDAAAKRLRGHIAIRPDLPWLRFYLASLAMDRREADAEALFRQAADAFAGADDAVGETYARINRARVLDREGATESALEEVGAASRAASRAAARDDGADLGHEVRLLELRIRFRRGDERVVLGHALRTLAESAGDGAGYSLKRDVSTLRGSVAFELGELAEALAHFEATAELARAAGDPPTEAAMATNAVRVALMETRGAGTGAVARAERAVELAVASGAPAIEANARLTLGRLVDDPGELAAGLEIARRIGDPGLESRALGFLALARLDDDPESARRLVESAREATARDADPLAMLWTWHPQFAVRWRTEGRDATLDFADRLFALIEAVSRAERDDVGSARLFAGWAEAHQWLAGMLFEDHLDNGDPKSLDRGFATLERMRAWRIGARERSGAATPRLVTLDDLESSLGADEAFVSIQSAATESAWGDFAGGSWLTVSTTAGTRLFRLPDRGRLEARIAMFLALVSRRDGAEIDAGRALFDDLFADAVATLPPTVGRLTLALDGALFAVPIAALATEDAKVEDARVEDFRVFGERFTLEQTPSASAWRDLRAMTERRASSALAIVDPRHDLPGAPDPLAAWPERAGGLAPLPSAAREGRALARSFGDSCRVLSGSDARETAIKSMIASAGIVHVAAHGLVDSRSPERSAIVLAPGSGDDGLLESREIRALDLDSPLVVLSTCESAAGPMLRGEGTLSLSRAFLAGGARAVVGSLWRLRDREASAIFERFYRHLRDGATISAALQRAQADRRRAGAPVHAWAGLAVIGDGDWTPIVEPARSTSSRLRYGSGLAAAAVVAALVALLAIAFARRA